MLPTSLRHGALAALTLGLLVGFEPRSGHAALAAESAAVGVAGAHRLAQVGPRTKKAKALGKGKRARRVERDDSEFDPTAAVHAASPIPAAAAVTLPAAATSPPPLAPAPGTPAGTPEAQPPVQPAGSGATPAPPAAPAPPPPPPPPPVVGDAPLAPASSANGAPPPPPPPGGTLAPPPGAGAPPPPPAAPFDSGGAGATSGAGTLSPRPASPPLPPTGAPSASPQVVIIPSDGGATMMNAGTPGPIIITAPSDSGPKIITLDGSGGGAETQTLRPGQHWEYSAWDFMCVASSASTATKTLNDAGARGWELDSLGKLKLTDLMCFKRPRGTATRVAAY